MRYAIIGNYNTTLINPKCQPGKDLYQLQITFNADLSELQPYLNAELTGTDYYPGIKTLIWKHNNKKYSIQAANILIAYVEGKSEADEMAEEIVSIINDVWDRKDDIEPDIEGRKPVPTVLDIFKLLPANNCKECGEETCMAFAASLQKDITIINDCPYLPEEEFIKLLNSNEVGSR